MKYRPIAPFSSLKEIDESTYLFSTEDIAFDPTSRSEKSFTLYPAQLPTC